MALNSNRVLPVLSVAPGGPELNSDGLWDRYRQGAMYPYVAC